MSLLFSLAVPDASRAVRVANGLSRTLALLMLVLSGCDFVPPGKPDPADRPITPAERTDFAGLFAQNCSGCHGAEGKLGPAPPLNDPLFLAIVPDEELLRVISQGRPGTPMPAFSQELSGALTDEQIRIIAAGLKKEFKADSKLSDKLPSYVGSRHAETDQTAAIARGEALFAKACATCHSEGPKSAGNLNHPALLTLLSDQVLRRIIITGRPDLGMPSYAEDAGRDGKFQPLTDGEIDDLVALLAHWRAQAPWFAAVQSTDQAAGTKTN